MVLGSALASAPSKHVIWLQASSAPAIKLNRHPGLVGAEAVEGQVGQSAGLPGTHPVLDPGVAAVAQLQGGDVVDLRCW